MFAQYNKELRLGINGINLILLPPPSFERTTKNTKNESSRETSRIDGERFH
jgi:hypothetical protein